MIIGASYRSIAAENNSIQKGIFKVGYEGNFGSIGKKFGLVVIFLLRWFTVFRAATAYQGDEDIEDAWQIKF